jgi:hypothetical protein
MVRILSFLIVFLIVGCWTAPTLSAYGIYVPYKLKDLMGESGAHVNSYWKTYYSPQKKIAINYYDSGFKFDEGANITESDEKIEIRTLPMFVNVYFFRNLDTDPKQFALTMQLKDQENGDTIIRSIDSMLVDNEIGYTYTKVTGSGETILQSVFVKHLGHLYTVFLTASNDANTQEEFDRTFDSVRFFD